MRRLRSPPALPNDRPDPHDPARRRSLAEAVTVCHVPRERWSVALRSLRSVLRHTPTDVPVVLITGGCPRETRRRLDRLLDGRPTRQALHLGRCLVPNEARNLVAALVTTPYVVFVDNDVLVAPGWLEALVACADETGAAVVGPLCLEGPWSSARVHVAGGDAHVATDDGTRRLVDRQGHWRRPWPGVQGTLVRGETELAEFHAILVRRATLDAIGGLDEAIRSFGEHLDFCMRVREAGGTVWFEPGAVVTYLWPSWLAPADLPFFTARWSPAWNAASAARLASRWHLPPTDERLVHMLHFADDHRRLWLKPFSLGRMLGRDARRRLRRALDRVVSPVLLARARAR